MDTEGGGERTRDDDEAVAAENRRVFQFVYCVQRGWITNPIDFSDDEFPITPGCQLHCLSDFDFLHKWMRDLYFKKGGLPCKSFINKTVVLTWDDLYALSDTLKTYGPKDRDNVKELILKCISSLMDGVDIYYTSCY